jgi:cob(I)alamin adenosyltransferase
MFSIIRLRPEYEERYTVLHRHVFPGVLKTIRACGIRNYSDEGVQVTIYTKTGDQGDTSLFGGQRVPKDALRIEAYGTVDELNSVLGLARAEKPTLEVDTILEGIQSDLFALGADLATPGSAGKKNIRRFEPADAAPLEKLIDRLEQSLKPLRHFILPGGSTLAARLHFARTVCRRAERVVVRLSRNEDIGEGGIMFLNRLSDLLFVLARYVNHTGGIAETKWKP